MGPRVLALDYGSARCGVAVSDPTRTVATPLEPVLRPATKKGFKALVERIRTLEVGRVIVGLPLSLSGADSPQTSETRAFAQRLREAVEIEVDLYDERFTTRLAQQGPSADTSLDSRAAAVLLDEWLTVFGHLPIEGA